MTDKMTPQAWLEKAMYEGGMHEGFEYGLRASDIDDSDLEFKAFVTRAEIAHSIYAERENELFGYAADHDYEWE